MTTLNNKNYIEIMKIYHKNDYITVVEATYAHDIMNVMRRRK